MKYIDGELVITNCRVFRPNTDWRDLALEIDMHFLKGTNSSTEWALHFRDVGNSGHVLSLYHNGNLAISFTKAHGEFNPFGISGIPRCQMIKLTTSCYRQGEPLCVLPGWPAFILCRK